MRWGLENLNITESRLKALGFEGMLRPIRTSCSDHVGTADDRIHQWDGKQWKQIAGWYSARVELIEPLLKKSAAQYTAEKGIKPRNCAAE